MLAPFPHKHLENANQSIAGNVLIAFHKGDGHHCDLRPESLEEVRQRGIGRELSASPTEHSYGGLCITSKLGQLLVNRILKPLQLCSLSFMHFYLIPHRSIMCNVRIFQVFLKTLIFEDQLAHNTQPPPISIEQR
jgi:hypothetical protein